MTKLSVNLNKVALLRNTRDYGVPDVCQAARTCIDAGAHGITVHPRPDERHIKGQDVHDLAALLANHDEVEFNIEGNPFEGPYLELIRHVKPTQATLVPDAPGQRTSDHGWDMVTDGEQLQPVIDDLLGRGIRVSLFIDPDLNQISHAAQCAVDRIELYTESYAAAFRGGRSGAAEHMLERFAEAAARAGELGLGVNAGHDLNVKNLGVFCQRLRDPGVLEVSIGHELISEAIWYGLDATVKAYLEVLG